ncbi:MAG: hypothetical protein IJ769_00265 [Clostridia bacterium]|nr:hypothetical protein [Clostridia bacterium]
MGLFDAAKAAVSGNRAYRLHVDANKLANEGKPAEARAKYQEALRLYEESDRLGNAAPNIMQGYALLLLREGQFDKAKALLERMARNKALSKDDWFQLRLQYSVCLWCVGELDKAIETIGRAAEYKMNGSIYSTLGMYWVDKAKQTGDFQAALDFNNQALEYDDEDAATLDSLGQLYEAMAEAEGDGEGAAAYRAQALDFYQRAHKARPRQITTLYYLARMYHRDGDDARARKLLSVKDSLYYTAICPVTKDMMDELAREVG